MIDNYKITVVTVTYGNRFHFLQQVIEAALREGVCKVIVVDNNSDKESRDKLVKFENSNSNIKVIYLSENTGSATGYKKGLEEAINDLECEYIWLLDDDNLPQNGSLKELLKAWDKIHTLYPEDLIALLSLRTKSNNIESIKTDSTLDLVKAGSILGFHIIEIPAKILRKIQRFFLNWINPQYEFKKTENKIKNLKLEIRN